MKKTLRLILGDQLNHEHSWFDQVEDTYVYCLMEMRQETDYVRHHIQKLMAFFHAMRSFSASLKAEGHTVIYLAINDSNNQQTLTENLDWLIEEEGIEKFEYILPDEYRLDKQLGDYCEDLGIESESFDSEHFMCERGFLKEFFKGKKTFLMESFYRDMRKRFNILMNNDEPYGGKWNYDKQNRNSLDKGHKIKEPEVPVYDLSELYKEIESAGIECIGNVNPKEFGWICTREEGLKWLDTFLDNALHDFGTYQDAMHTDYKFLYHSRLSFLLNSKLLSPLEVVNRTVSFWKSQKDIDIAQVEGFVRQIIGWREYMRGIYWAFMPGYGEKNFFNHTRSLPEWFWTGETKMNCLSHAINQSLDEAYAHHIQRLMITGNFALLAGVDPDEVDAWYLGIYIDAIEWVEITNTRGMSQFADGGIVGTKPYISSASYIHKMSNYCESCRYDYKKKTGENACPFNSLYWHFYEINRDKLGNNPRVGMMYRTWERMGSEKQEAYLKQAEFYLDRIEKL